MAETFLIAFERRTGFDLGSPSARPWLYGIASNLLARHARSQERQWRAYARSTPSTTLPDESDATAARVDASVSIDSISEALAAMSPMDRDVLLLFAWAELSYPEIAEALEIPVGTVRSKLHRSRRALRGALGAAEAHQEQELCHD